MYTFFDGLLDAVINDIRVNLKGWASYCRVWTNSNVTNDLVATSHLSIRYNDHLIRYNDPMKYWTILTRLGFPVVWNFHNFILFYKVDYLEVRFGKEVYCFEHYQCCFSYSIRRYCRQLSTIIKFSRDSTVQNWHW